jgi:L-lactate utilization protein LutB
MASKPMSTADLLAQRRDEVGKEKLKAEGALEKLQEKALSLPANDPRLPELREKIKAAKAEIAPLCDQFAELSRNVSTALGGASHYPER